MVLVLIVVRVLQTVWKAACRLAKLESNWCTIETSKWLDSKLDWNRKGWQARRRYTSKSDSTSSTSGSSLLPAEVIWPKDALPSSGRHLYRWLKNYPDLKPIPTSCSCKKNWPIQKTKFLMPNNCTTASRATTMWNWNFPNKRNCWNVYQTSWILQVLWWRKPYPKADFQRIRRRRCSLTKLQGPKRSNPDLWLLFFHTLGFHRSGRWPPWLALTWGRHTSFDYWWDLYF